MVYDRRMIQTTTTYHCRVCGSTNIVRNGTNKCGQAQYHCKACGAYRVREPVPTYSEEMKRTILDTYKERASLRGLQRIFGVARRTVLRWLKTRVQQLPDLKDTLAPPQADDVLELDELWSFVFKKDAKRWLWLALCRRTRQIVAGSGHIVSDSSRLCSAINHLTTMLCATADLEKDRVLRTKRPRRWRSVLFQRSICAVSPLSLPTAWWVAVAKTFW